VAAVELKRALSPMERALWHVDLAAPLNFTTIARVTGPVSDEALRAALVQLQARHPHLRERIEDHHFVEDEGVRLDLRVSESSWVHEVERELNVPITAPLGRFVRSGEYLLITLHHAIGDGMSGVYLMRDWLKAAAGERLEPLTDPGGVDALLPKQPGFFDHAGFMAADALQMLKAGRVLHVAQDEPRYAYERRVRVTPVTLEAELVTALSARARAEQTTVHGALSAAMILGILADAGLAQGGVAFGSPVNVRSSIGVGEELGFYVSMLAFRTRLRSGVSLWDLAREVRRTLETQLARKAGLSMLKLMPFVWSVVGAEELAPRALAEGWPKLVPTTSGLTNLGRLAVQTEFGPLRLAECHFAANPSALGDFLATATSLHGRLFWNFVWPSPALTEAHAEKLIADIASRLRAAV